MVAASKTRVPPASSPAAPADRVPSILPVRDLRLPAPVAPARVLALAPVPALADLAPEALELPAEHRRLLAKHRARSVLQGRRVAVAVNSIPRPKKAR